MQILVLEVWGTGEALKYKKSPQIVYWDQEELFDEKSGGEKSRGTVPLTNSLFGNKFFANYNV
jgi:hypothetical protein